jgi:hypothetical protein
VKLTTHLHLVPRSKNKWSYTSTPPYAFMAWCSVKKKSTGDELERTLVESLLACKRLLNVNTTYSEGNSVKRIGRLRQDVTWKEKQLILIIKQGYDSNARVKLSLLYQDPSTVRVRFACSQYRQHAAG